MPDSVAVTAYDPEWPVEFARVAAGLRVALGAVAVRIDHIGSTSVPGLTAKPVIDVQISVVRMAPVAVYEGPLGQGGYTWRALPDDVTRRFYREPAGQRRTHVHVKRAGSWSEEMVLLFRDYLRARPPAAEAYAALKRELAERFRDDRVAYANAKSPLIWDLLRQADEWSRTTGWEPGPSDA